jgi:hypothetical protein
VQNISGIDTPAVVAAVEQAVAVVILDINEAVEQAGIQL